MDEESKTDEVNRLEDVFVANGFSRKRTQAALHVKPRTTSSEDSSTNKKTWSGPRFSQSLQTLNIQTAFASRPTLRNILTHVKNENNQKRNWV